MNHPGSDTEGLPPAPEVVQIEVGLLQNFVEILYCPETREAAVVDPAWEPDRVLRELAALNLNLRSVLITHTHNDHIEAVDAIVNATRARVFVHPSEQPRVEAACRTVSPVIECVPVHDRMDIVIGKCGVRVLETFGHTVGGICFLADGFIIAGDVLFVGGCGRTDFSGGDTNALWRSLQRLMALPEETRVYPGHDYGRTPTSTLGREMLENPYLRGDFEAFRALRERRRPTALV
jgi:hydroxyacylglutathione hydrolase